MIAAGELGTDPRVLEPTLSRILDLAHTWGAVLLLDEADVFLERRSIHDLHRNALVSIFLRLLEYFQGILFLTTNRVETFDPAFQSRIHVGLHYRDLDRKAMRVIWKTFLQKVAKEEVESGARKGPPRTIITDDEIEELCKKELNGRMIKNVVIMAQALAGNAKEEMEMRHLRSVLDVAEDFERDLNGKGQMDSMNCYA